MVRKKVLIVEFDAREAAGLAALLRRNGYETCVAQTGAEAIELHRNEDPDLAALNLLMPDMSSADIMRRLEGGARHLPVIAINQLAAGRSQFYQKLGADAQVSKPVDPAEFLKLVEQLIGPGAREAAKAGRLPNGDKAPPADEALPPRGSFKTTPFHVALAQVFRRRASGALTVQAPSGKAEVHFRDGVPVAVVAEGLARRLARDGLVSDDEARRVRRQAAVEHISEEDALARMNVMLAKELEAAAREFAAGVLGELCRPSETPFSWTPQAPAGKESPFDPATIIADAARRFIPAEKVAGALHAKGRMEKPMRLGDDPARLPELTQHPEMIAMVEAARRGRVLGDVLQLAGHSRERLERAAYALAILKVIDFELEEAVGAARERPRPRETSAATAPATAPQFPPDDEPPAVERPAEQRPPAERSPERISGVWRRPEPPATVNPAGAARRPEPPSTGRSSGVWQRPEPPATGRSSGVWQRPEPPAPPRPPADEPTAFAFVDDAESAGDSEPLGDQQLLQLAEEMLRTKTYSKAQRCAADWLERCGDDRRVLLLFARAAFRNRFAEPLARLLDSLDALRRALALDPRFVEARCELAAILAEAGEAELAAAELEAALAIDPNHAEAQRDLRILRRRLAHAE